MLNNIFYYLLLIIFITGCATNESWMRDSRRYINDKTIGELFIPGSHLANAYNIKGNESVCIGESIESENMSINTSLRQNIIASGHYTQKLFIKYLNTQQYDINEQLNNGIRYLELQVCKQNNIFYTSNIYLNDKLNTIITQVNDFTDNHTNEIIIIDLDNNLWGESGRMNAQDATLMYNDIISVIGHKLISKAMRNNTISQLKDAAKQIVLMSSNTQLASFPFVWDKTQVAITAIAQYSTIQKLQAIQNLYIQPQNSYTISIIPFYTVLPEYGFDNQISNTNNADPIILNFLNQTIANHAMIIVADSTHFDSVIELTIQNNKTIKKTTQVK